jgi:hypothetical protein
VYTQAVNDRALPGQDLVETGLRDLRDGKESIAGLLVSIGAHRLRQAGIDVVAPIANPERKLYEMLAASYGDDAHSQYNALIRRLVSYERALECGL